MNFFSSFHWWLFAAIVIIMLAVDLFAHRTPHKIKVREALTWSAVWVGLAVLFNIWIYVQFGSERAIKFLTGYVVEKSLSMDNVFVFVMLFALFKIPPKYQHRVLFWGVLGAITLRAILIYFGLAFIKMFDWALYLFGAFLLYTAYSMMNSQGLSIEADNPLLTWCQKHLRLTKDFVQEKFLVKRHGKWFATPLLLALILIEFSDVIFAIDSIPAIFAITTDPFIVYSSNIFAILGLRSLYFAIGHAIAYLRYLKLGLAVILGFVGIKMLAHGVYHVPPLVSLGIIVGILTVTIFASLSATKKSPQ